MKPIMNPKAKVKNVIDDDYEYNQVLFDLGLLDDEDNWKLYQLQEENLEVTRDMPFEDYLRFCGKTEEEIKFEMVAYHKRVAEIEEFKKSDFAQFWKKMT